MTRFECDLNFSVSECDMCFVKQHVATTTGEGEVNERMGFDRDLSQGAKWGGDEGC